MNPIAAVLEKTAETPTVSVIRLSGELGASEMESLARALTSLLAENRRRIVLNFRNVRHVSLGGIARLAERNLRFKALGGEVKLSGVTPYVVNLFNLVGAYSSFDISASEEEAVARFENG
jgi:anti-anti-sigma factor